MPPLSPTSNRGRFIIRADDATHLQAFISEIGQDPAIELVDVIGPAGQPHTAVVAITPDTARALEQRFRTANQLKIEPDRPLSLFGDAMRG